MRSHSSGATGGRFRLERYAEDNLAPYRCFFVVPDRADRRDFSKWLCRGSSKDQA
jgi:hypothetical protein